MTVCYLNLISLSCLFNRKHCSLNLLRPSFEHTHTHTHTHTLTHTHRKEGNEHCKITNCNNNIHLMEFWYSIKTFDFNWSRIKNEMKWKKKIVHWTKSLDYSSSDKYHPLFLHNQIKIQNKYNRILTEFIIPIPKVNNGNYSNNNK